MSALGSIIAADYAETREAPSDLHIRLQASAILNGQFDGVPLNLFDKVDWVGAAQWLADSQGEPEDEAQAIAEIEMMLAKSDYYDRWRHLSERAQDQWVEFENFWDGRGRFAPVGEVA